jgi:hypothetical protein
LKNEAFENSSKDFFIRIVSRRHATWQGTVTLTDRKATQAARLPRAAGPFGARSADTVATAKETFPFRSMLELIHLIDSAFCDDEDNMRGNKR